MIHLVSVPSDNSVDRIKKAISTTNNEFHEICKIDEEYLSKNNIKLNKESFNKIIYYRKLLQYRNLNTVDTNSKEHLEKLYKLEEDNVFDAVTTSELELGFNYKRNLENKVWQSYYAKKVGLVIPNFLFTNSKNELIEFHNEYKTVITKNVVNSFFYLI